MNYAYHINVKVDCSAMINTNEIKWGEALLCLAKPQALKVTTIQIVYLSALNVAFCWNFLYDA